MEKSRPIKQLLQNLQTGETKTAIAYESMGGKFENYCLCAGEVRRLFDYSLLAELLARAGFSNIVESAPLKTELPDVFGEAVAMEHENYPSLPHNLVIEVCKT